LPACGGIGFSARPPTTGLERSGIVEADEIFILESSKARWSDLPRQTRRRFPAVKTSQNPSDASKPSQKGWDYPTDRALPKPDISSATDASGGMFIAENQKLG
jgi:hypothetical protein